MTYFDEIYPRIYFIVIILGWICFLIYLAFCSVWLTSLDTTDKYKASKQYYGLISLVALFVIGILISIFLPTPFYFGL